LTEENIQIGLCKISFFFISDISGFILGIGDEVTSESSRRYFDVSLQRSPSVTSKIRVMTSDTHNIEFFRRFMEEQQPICLQNVSN